LIYPFFRLGGGSGDANIEFNFGQMPFLHQPSGYQAIAGNNLPEPTIKNGKEHFEAKLYSGTGSSNAITGLEFSPDLIWIKVRDAADNHVLVDTIRGTDSVLFSNSTDVEASSFSRFTSFDLNGFTVDGSDTAWNNSSNDYVAWCWKAGGTAVSNTDGTITSSVSANTDAGFSIVSYTGTGANATVGHGLNSAPEFVIVKSRDTSQNWACFHTGSSNGHILTLNTSFDRHADSTYWQSTDPSSTVVTLGSNNLTNKSGDDMIMYAWHSVEGFSKFGSYEANGVDVDGPFIYTGFRPAFVMIKNIDAAFEWMMYDTARNPNNQSENFLAAEQNSAEQTNRFIDILSNGFKCRDNSNQLNKSGDTHIYMAFAENPFGGENQPPATAR